MGTFANVPEDKYGSLRPEDREAVDAYRNRSDDEGNYSDVVTRDENQAVDTPTQPASTKQRTSTKNQSK